MTEKPKLYAILYIVCPSRQGNLNFIIQLNLHVYCSKITA